MKPTAFLKIVHFAAAVCCVLFLYSCQKGITSKPAVALTVLDSTRNIAGSRQMHGFENKEEIDVYDSVYQLNDTSLVFTVDNDSVIEVGGMRLSYVKDLSSGSMSYYWGEHKDSLFSEVSVSYYFRNDSIALDKLLLTTVNGYVETVYYTPK